MRSGATFLRVLTKSVGSANVLSICRLMRGKYLIVPILRVEGRFVLLNLDS